MSLKTKESRRKLRRWTYVAVLTYPDNRQLRVVPTTIEIGPHKAAAATAVQIHHSIAQQYPEAQALRIEMEDHETVSHEIVELLDNYKALNVILMDALELLAKDHPQEGKDATQTCNEYFSRAQQARREQAENTPSPSLDASPADRMEDGAIGGDTSGMDGQSGLVQESAGPQSVNVEHADPAGQS